jgi:hypothetical protein
MPRPHNVASPLHRFAAATGAVLAMAMAGAAAEPPTAATRVREGVLRMTDFLDTTLPGVLAKNNITFHLHPKFSDLRHREFMRFPFELRYGYTNRLEFQGGLVPFVPNPLNRGAEHRWGPGELKLGARYDLRRSLGIFDATTVGLETRAPIGHPPADLNDHYTHLRPYVTVARKLPRWPSTTLYANAAYDHSFDFTHRAPPPVAVVRRDIVELAPGLLFKPGEFGYFAEYRFRQLREDDGRRLAHALQFGTIWDIPLARTSAWGLTGKWQLDLACKFNREEDRDSNQGISVRVNWRTTIREALGQGKALLLRKRDQTFTRVTP